MVELMSWYMFLPSPCPPVAFDAGNDRWSMWTLQHATTASRKDFTLAGALAEGYVFHSLWVGGATHTSAGGAAPEVLQREGRWASGAYETYVRSHGKDASWVAEVTAQEEIGGETQPGQRTEWEKANQPLDLTK